MVSNILLICYIYIYIYIYIHIHIKYIFYIYTIYTTYITVYHIFSGTAIGTTFAPPYACLFMDKIETAFLETQELQPLVWSRYIDDIFLSGHMVSKNFKLFCVVLMSSILTSNLLMSQAKKALHFLTLKLDYYSKIIRNLYVKSTDRHQYLYYLSA